MSSSLAELSELARRVRPEDLRHVTPNDIERVAHNMTPQQLEVVMKVMVRENKFMTVGAEAKPNTVVAAMNRVERSHYLMASKLLLGEPHNQHAVLGRVPDSWKDMCEMVVRRKLGLYQQ